LNKKLRYALFDLDNTLYPRSCGLMEEIGRRMNQFMIERLGFSEATVAEHRDSLLLAHGTTLNALRRRYSVDPDEFLEFVHDIPLETFLDYNEALDRMLGALPLQKVIFTNADAKHARHVLARLGILPHFESIIDIHMLEFANKPDRRSYRKALDFIAAEPEECILLEDFIVNIRPARKLGMTTVLVGDGVNTEGAHHRIEDITELAELLQEIGLKSPCPQ
jgi:putative hydrolase of the HAD superfamily